MMHSKEDFSTSPVPAFLHKLWTLVEDESTNDLIAWDPSGRSFHVFDQGRFSKEVLPLYFKHNNIASFIRQLNMYGFRKVTNVEHGGLKTEKDDMEFSHQYFQRGKEHLLENIKRKVTTTKADDVKVKHDDVNKVLMDVHHLKGKQESINSKFDTLKRENEALWREVASLRQKHLKQQQIVNKLIQFLITIVGNRGVGSLKRPAIMACNSKELEQPTRPAKVARIMKTNPDPMNSMHIQTVSSEQPAMSTKQPLEVQIREVLSSGGTSSSASSATSLTTEHPVVVLPSSGTLNVSDSKQPTIIVLNRPPTVRSMNGTLPGGTVPKTDQVSAMSPTNFTGIVTSPPPDDGDGSGTSDGRDPSCTPIVSELPTLDDGKDIVQPVGIGDLDLGHLDTGGMASTSDDRPQEAIDLGEPLLQAMTQSLQTPVNTTTIAVSPHHETVSAVSDDVDNINDSLESLKELLAGGAGINIDPGSLLGFQLDKDTLHGLFTPEAPVPPTPETWLKMESEENSTSSPNPDNQLVQYVPADDFGTLFDFDLDNGPSYDFDTNKTTEESSSVTTPTIDVSSPLAQRRKNRNVIWPTEEID
ncbi:hypothetical protein LSH36_232g02019 [Paralvinella palmiformis]|uniref:HSF-type DNA-binding domain-containing protein n=1 Tax=Paralvinella palmiformis TaxID=53620 RepID=A0AAD9N3W2_9ANNE|nr:hypothetical protein LSH36_232g02019 [Paralvinella palmiformis]